ncbi:MAG: cytochrome c biogenesis protein CcsA [Methylococcales bacterium]
MTPIVLGISSILLYILSTSLVIKDSFKNSSKRLSVAPAWLAVFLHFGYTASLFIQQHAFNFNLSSTASIISALVALLLLLAILNKPVEKLGLAIFPVAAISLLIMLFFPDQERDLQINSWQMSVHILSSIIAFSLLNIAALQAIFLAIQEQQLRTHPPKRFIQTLPPLQTMESLLFQMIAIGLLFLTVSLISGFVFIEDLFAQHLVHKTVLSIIAWFTFSALLLGRVKYGWRGQTAVKWTLTGFSLLLLAYFGSKFVLEVILNRT